MHFSENILIVLSGNEVHTDTMAHRMNQIYGIGFLESTICGTYNVKLLAGPSKKEPQHPYEFEPRTQADLGYDGIVTWCFASRSVCMKIPETHVCSSCQSTLTMGLIYRLTGPHAMWLLHHRTVVE